MRRALFLLTSLLLFWASAQAAPAVKGGWVTHDVTVTITGSDWLFVHSDIIAKLTDAEGEMTDRPSHITVKNLGKMPCYFSGTGAGSTFDSEVGPGQEVREYLAIYSPANKPFRSWRTTFKFWKGPLPKEAAEKKSRDEKLRQKQAEKQREQEKQLLAQQQEADRQRLASTRWDLWVTDRQKESQEKAAAEARRKAEEEKLAQQRRIDEEKLAEQKRLVEKKRLEEVERNRPKRSLSSSQLAQRVWELLASAADFNMKSDSNKEKEFLNALDEEMKNMTVTHGDMDVIMQRMRAEIGYLRDVINGRYTSYEKDWASKKIAYYQRWIDSAPAQRYVH